MSHAPASSLVCPCCGFSPEGEPPSPPVCPKEGAWLVEAVEVGRAPTDPFLGTEVGGKYAVVGIIGAGGMGAVYRAIQQPVGRPVALKVIRQAAAREAELEQRFRKEAEAVARLKHPNTVTLHDFGVSDEDGHLYMVLEYVEGPSLEAVLKAEGRLDVGRSCRLVAGVLDALVEAHELGLVHRDLKPANIMLVETTWGGEAVKVLDFGIAKFRGSGGSASLTRPGYVMGTAKYMSPEQAWGKQVDARSDLYAMGLVLYECLAGRPPFVRTDPLQILVAHRQEAPPPLPEELPIPAAVRDVVARSLEKRKEDRHRDARAMVEALRSAAGMAGEAVIGAASPTPLSGVVPDGELGLEEAATAAAPALVEAETAPEVGQAKRAHRGGEVDPAAAPPASGQGTRPVSADQFTSRGGRRVVGVLLGLLAVLGAVAALWQLGRGPAPQPEPAAPASAAPAPKPEPPAPPAPAEQPAPPPAPAEAAFIPIPAGRYPVGCREGDLRCSADERPAFEAELAGFQLMTHEVTSGDYAACVAVGVCQAAGLKEGCNGGREDRRDHPANCVDWDGAAAWCRWKGWRLPTEREWEASARGREGRSFPWGADPPTCERTVMRSEAGDGCGLGNTLPVSSRPKDESWCRARDLGGSVREWVDADFAPYPDGKAPEGAQRKVSRGGSWMMEADRMFTSYTRDGDEPTTRQPDLGFRCARASTGGTP